MEREEIAPYHVEHDSVLILIIMEDTHGELRHISP